MIFKVLGQIREACKCLGAQMVFDPLDIGLLRFWIQSKEGEKARESFVPPLDASRDFSPLIRQDQAAILFVIDIPEFTELLHHARHGGLLHIERRSDVHDTGVALFLDELMNPLEIILRALTWHRRH